MSIVSHPGARTNLETTGASFPVVIPILGGTQLSSKGLVKGLQVRGQQSKDLRSELSDPEQLCSRVEFV